MIEQLELTNFKNFRSATLPLGKFTVIVGTNASGKSNIRDAFRFVHGISRGYSLADIIGEKWGHGGELLWRGVRGGAREVAYLGGECFQLSLIASDGSELLPRRGATFSITVQVKFGASPSTIQFGPRVREESFSTEMDGGYEATPLSDDLERLKVVRVSKTGSTGKFKTFPRTHPVIGSDVAASMLGQTADELLKLTTDIIDPSDKSQSATSRFRDVIQSMRFHDLNPDSLRMPSTPGQTVLGDRGENLSSVLLAICEDASLKAAVMEWLRQLTPLDVVDFELEPDAAGRVLVALVEGNGKKTSAYSASDGTLRFLAMLAALYGPNAAGFYFFDEIETGIHPTRLHLLIQLIEQRVARGDVQVVATTHSPQLLGLLSEESQNAAVLTYRLEGHLEGHIKRIMDIPNAAEVLKNQSLMRLHESGWLENAVEFLEGEENDE